MKKDNVAAPHAAGYIFQLERALHHLAHASSRETAVAIEHVDDVAVFVDGKVVLVEQDKSTTSSTAKVLGDRTKAVWRTLQIWLRHLESSEGAHTEQYLFFVNHWVASPLAQAIKDCGAGEIEVSDLVAQVRAVGGKRSNTKIQAIIDDVLARSDEILEDLFSKVELVEAQQAGAQLASMANGLGIDPRADAENILQGVLGWLTTRARSDWSEKRVCLITRTEVLIHCHALQDKQARSRLLPRASADIVLGESDRQQALARNFVEHLSKIDAEHDDVVTAIDHFLKFNIEKHRLVRSGEVPDKEWPNRSNRLRERWSGIRRRRRREMIGTSNAVIGQAILAEVTYGHREPLDGHSCDELYMTSGHYHRLADDNEVWWDPAFEGGGNER